MNTAQLNDLEYTVDDLIKNTERLKSENTALRHQLNISIHEKTRLQESNQRAAIKVKHILRQLKETLS